MLLFQTPRRPAPLRRLFLPAYVKQLAEDAGYPDGNSFWAFTTSIATGVSVAAFVILGGECNAKCSALAAPHFTVYIATPVLSSRQASANMVTTRTSWRGGVPTLAPSPLRALA